jgi:hypothetical protein
MILLASGGEEERTCDKCSTASVSKESESNHTVDEADEGERDDRGGGAATEGPPGVINTGIGGAPDDIPDQSRQGTGDDKKESRRWMKMREDQSGRSTTVVGGSKSGRWTA